MCHLPSPLLCSFSSQPSLCTSPFPLSLSCSIHLQEIKIRIFKETFSRSLRFSHCSVVIVSSSALSHSCERAGNCRAIRAPRVPFSLSSRRLFPCFLRVIVAIMKLDSARRIQMPSSPSSPPSPFLPFIAVFASSAASAFSLVGAVQKLAAPVDNWIYVLQKTPSRDLSAPLQLLRKNLYMI